jgi:hypothetical protein
VNESAPPTVLVLEGQEGMQMNTLLVGICSVAGPLAAVGMFKLQAHLEQWDQRRHAED